MNIPTFPRCIRLALKVDRKFERKKPKREVDLNKITKARVESDGALIYPEVFVDRWYPLVADGHCLATIVRSMVGTLSEKRREQLETAWRKWLKEWIKKNRLKIKLEDSPSLKPKNIKKLKKLRRCQMTINEAVEKIKKAGPSNTQITPMSDSDRFKIEINLGQGWATILTGLKRVMAEDVIRQASNRVLLG